ncbi:MAG TPA: GNAT family N-acetyltransferase [Lacipirellulaceae bacterium]|jgi:RimJ/RimL family protein N-acetyltransferase|nr:GNAT family N-acetyltransferase [Lacipirellulaceae bacterium]
MERILLRQWRDSDLEPFAAMNADAEVMRYFPAVKTREESAIAMSHYRALIEERGWGFWALDVGDVFAGFVGLAIPGFEAPFAPCVEVGWRLRREYWGRSIAYRAALEALVYGFEILKLPEIVSFTAATNLRSRRLMERLAFVHDAASDFEHPSIPEGHELRPHVLYRKRA